MFAFDKVSLLSVIVLMLLLVYLLVFVHRQNGQCLTAVFYCVIYIPNEILLCWYVYLEEITAAVTHVFTILE